MGTLLALAAAVLWGGGDFSGGMGVKAAGGTLRGALRIVLYGHAASLVVLLCLNLLLRQALPHGAPALWGLAGGLAGATGLTAFYIALSRGQMGASAALSGLVAAAIPAAVSAWIDGRPSLLLIAGFVLAGAAIWLIAAGGASEDVAASPSSTRTTMLLAITGGIGFGFYFVALRLANPLGVLMPMTLARSASVTLSLLIILVLGSETPAPRFHLGAKALRWALSGALLDTGGNLLFIAATRVGRLDVAAVLASLYPASTIMLAGWLLGERLTRRQLAGMGVAVAAIVLIAI